MTLSSFGLRCLNASYLRRRPATGLSLRFFPPKVIAICPFDRFPHHQNLVFHPYPRSAKTFSPLFELLWQTSPYDVVLP